MPKQDLLPVRIGSFAHKPKDQVTLTLHHWTWRKQKWGGVFIRTRVTTECGRMLTTTNLPLLQHTAITAPYECIYCFPEDDDE